jgi:hypothetical protein
MKNEYTAKPILRDRCLFSRPPFQLHNNPRINQSIEKHFRSYYQYVDLNIFKSHIALGDFACDPFDSSRDVSGRTIGGLIGGAHNSAMIGYGYKYMGTPLQPIHR